MFNVRADDSAYLIQENGRDRVTLAENSQGANRENGPVRKFDGGAGELVVADHEVEGVDHALGVVGVEPGGVLVGDGLHAHVLDEEVELLDRVLELRPRDANLLLENRKRRNGANFVKGKEKKVFETRLCVPESLCFGRQESHFNILAKFKPLGGGGTHFARGKRKMSAQEGKTSRSLALPFPNTHTRVESQPCFLDEENSPLSPRERNMYKGFGKLAFEAHQ